jgi:hypothetical protein
MIYFKKDFRKRRFIMFGLEYLIALSKVFFNIAFAIVTAIPFYFAWNVVAPIYLSFIPKLYQNFPYWHIVGIFLVITFIGDQINKLVPKIISIEQTNGK